MNGTNKVRIGITVEYWWKRFVGWPLFLTLMASLTALIDFNIWLLITQGAFIGLLTSHKALSRELQREREVGHHLAVSYVNLLRNHKGRNV